MDNGTCFVADQNYYQTLELLDRGSSIKPLKYPVLAISDGEVGSVYRIGGRYEFTITNQTTGTKVRYANLHSTTMRSDQKVKEGEIVGYYQ